MERQRFILDESRLPKEWYNIQADLPGPLPPVLHPVTLEPVKPEDLAPLFPMEVIRQEVSTERYIAIPPEVREIYRLWRPTPLVRAVRLEKALGTPAHIYYKNEGVSPPGSHKPNTAVAQAFYNKAQGVKRLSTETGAGQWGSSLALACNMFGLECQVYMVKVSYQQKPYRRSLMHLWGASVTASPSSETEAGRRILAQDPDSNGSLGIAISEAVEVAMKDDETKYSLGSVLNHVLMHQTVVGQEAMSQMEMVGEEPDVVIGCVGGGSNLGGIAFPFLRRVLKEGARTRFVAVEPRACPSLTKGIYAYDYGDTARMAPVTKMYTLGHSFVPSGIHAGGLRYHGMAPLVSALAKAGYIEAVAYHQNPAFEAAVLFARTEGVVPAPETAHAIKAAVDEALRCKESGERRVILLNFSGHGHFDLAAYDAYLAGKLTDTEYSQDQLSASLAELPKVQ
ncbi:MAG TPA: TrpB-like pyridoxal phosphate-dependent enzyme [Anaerolineae bacterium]|nr:TrpB-like pyridoxal phosphate-dependent enzyme [Anaerolineae bacterium]